jgi:hypothetical protein
MENVHCSEIWDKSNYQHKEGNVRNEISERLTQLNFFSGDQLNFVHSQNFKQVKVQFVDDIRQIADVSVSTSYLYPKNVTVLTDNFVSCPTLYKVIRFPKSFFGIYSYRPEILEWNPDRDFSFCVNRIDTARILLLLELAWQVSLDRGYVNFNCSYRYPDHTLPNISNSGASFVTMWAQVQSHTRHLYQKVYNSICPVIPIKNYEIDFDEIQTRSWLNIVVETYANDNTVALSEKIFRALVTPAPWTVYSGRYTVARLESLGFDCMRDLINHDYYDFLPYADGKIQAVIWQSLESIKLLKSQPFDRIKSRCLKAAEHNIKVLQHMQENFPIKFKIWLDQLSNHLLD